MFRGCVAACSLVCCAHLLAGGSPSIAVFLDFESEPSAGTLSEMKNEITAIMKPSGLQFDWRMLKERQSGESFPDLVVVTFKGSCQADQPILYNELGPVHEGSALAFTQISDGRILPFSDVDCDTIRKYIAVQVASAMPEKRDSMLGRAVGRVLAHEMYHMFAGTAAHGNDGVARPFTPGRN